MEYEFTQDRTTGRVRAKFSFEHEVIGHWLETEIANDADKLVQVLAKVEQARSTHNDDILILGKEYSVKMNAEDVIVQINTAMNDNSESEDLLDDDMRESEELSVASCGLDDFYALLKSWAKFN